MALTTALRKIVSKAAGTYFIVTDESQVAAIEAENKMRLLFINSQKGPINSLYSFAKGDTSGFTSMFGKSTRVMEKKGNFSIALALECLNSGPISVVNLRAFDDTLDTAGIVGISPNIVDEESRTVGYTKLFNTNKFWVPKPKNIPGLFTTGGSLLNFGNVGTSDLSIIVTFADESDVLSLTNQGDYSLRDCTLEIDEYPALNFDMLLKDTFVTVWLFNNSFNTVDVSTNANYGQYFNVSGNIDITNIETLSELSASGFVKKFTGSLIPHLISESSEIISIDTIINQTFANYGLISYIDDSLFEADNQFLIDIYGVKFFNGTTTKVVNTSNYLLSYVVPATLTTIATTVYPPTVKAENIEPAAGNKITYPCVKIDANSFEGSFDQGIRIGDYIQGIDSNTIVKISSITVLDSAAIIGATTDTYNKVKYTCDGEIGYVETVTGTPPDTVTSYSVVKLNLFIDSGTARPFDLNAYIPRTAQFTDGSASKQSEILDMMNSTGIVKGIIGTAGLRYLVDCFKSFVEPNYKYQFENLIVTLDDENRFLRGIINEPFVEDLENSTNPLFKQSGTSSFDWSYLKTGGNANYSSKFLTKKTSENGFCFYFGPGNIVNYVTRPVAGLVSNKFYEKTNDFDVVANESGYIDITELETQIDDSDRVYCESFKYNPIINFNGGYTIYGNNANKKTLTKQSQIHNSELLCYIKNGLYSLAKSEAFKKGNYDDYLRSQTETSNFMNALALAGAIKSDFTVVCDSTNNTDEIANNRIKLIDVSYTPINSLEKVVFALKIN